jgi:hypothetical protein
VSGQRGTTAAGIVVDHLAQGADRAVVHVGRGHGDIAQARCAEPAHVRGVPGVLDPALVAGGQGTGAVPIVEAGIVVMR